MTTNASRRTVLAALAVIVVALGARVGWVLREGPPAPLANDSVQYRAFADSLVSTGRYVGPKGDRATRMPGYPVFLAAVETAFGPSTRAVQWAQCLLGALTCLFVFLWARSLLDPPWALACGLAAACYFDLIAPCAWTLTECLYSFLLAASFWLLYAEEFPVARRAALGGLALALTALVKPEVLPFALVILGGSPLMIKGFTRRGAVLATAVFVAVFSIWVVRNALVFHRLVPVSTMGNSSRYLGLRLPLERQSVDYAPRYTPPDGADELQSEAGFQIAFRELKARVPVGRRVEAYAFNLLTVYYPFLPQYDWTYALLVPFWAFGVWLALFRRDLWPMAGMVLGLDVVFFFMAGPVSRYRFGFSPVLILLAGVGAQGLRERLSKKTFVWTAAGWTAVNFAVWFASGELRDAALRLKAGLWG
jgi:hypothetical protein